jgi:hypothetical protein
MKINLIRCVSLLLVICLVGDSVSASSLRPALAPVHSTRIRIREEALALEAIPFLGRLLKQGLHHVDRAAVWLDSIGYARLKKPALITGSVLLFMTYMGDIALKIRAESKANAVAVESVRHLKWLTPAVLWSVAAAGMVVTLFYLIRGTRMEKISNAFASFTRKHFPVISGGYYSRDVRQRWERLRKSGAERKPEASGAPPAEYFTNGEKIDFTKWRLVPGDPDRLYFIEQPYIRARRNPKTGKFDIFGGGIPMASPVELQGFARSVALGDVAAGFMLERAMELYPPHQVDRLIRMLNTTIAAEADRLYREARSNVAIMVSWPRLQRDPTTPGRIMIRWLNHSA